MNVTFLGTATKVLVAICIYGGGFIAFGKSRQSHDNLSSCKMITTELF